MNTPYLIGVSGKIGSGKNYFAENITKVLSKKGYTIKESSFATPLKQEATFVIEDLKSINSDEKHLQTNILDLSKKHKMTYQQMFTLYSYVKDEIKTFPNMDGYSRSEGVRRVLQELGTNIRREQKANYWTEKFKQALPTDCDFVFVTDVRFPNEADCVLETQGIMVRVEVPADLILSRVKDRDGLLYSKEALEHVSETSLDNYSQFDIIVGASFEAEEISNKILDLTVLKN